MARVLAVDDNPSNRKLLRLFLEAAGHEVLQAEDGREAARVACSDRPDVVLMDIQMPVMDGFEALAAIREEESTRSIPIIAVTAMGMDSEMDRIETAGFDGLLGKPYQRRELLEAVEKALAKAP